MTVSQWCRIHDLSCGSQIRIWNTVNNPNFPAVFHHHCSRLSVERLSPPPRWGTEIFRTFVVKHKRSRGLRQVRFERDAKTIAQRLPPDLSRIIASLPACVGSFHPTFDTVYVGFHNICVTTASSPFESYVIMRCWILWGGSRGMLFCIFCCAGHICVDTLGRYFKRPVLSYTQSAKDSPPSHTVGRDRGDE